MGGWSDSGRVRSGPFSGVSGGEPPSSPGDSGLHDSGLSSPERGLDMSGLFADHVAGKIRKVLIKCFALFVMKVIFLSGHRRHYNRPDHLCRLPDPAGISVTRFCANTTRCGHKNNNCTIPTGRDPSRSRHFLPKSHTQRRHMAN